MMHSNYKKGYSLVEVLVAIGILMLSIVGPLTIAMKSIQSSQYARQQNTAFFLAQEGITVANTIRNNAGIGYYLARPGFTSPWVWINFPALAPCFAASGCNIDFSDKWPENGVVDCATPANCIMRFNDNGGRAAYNVSSGELSPYRRVITMRRLTPNEVLVTSEVTWDTTLFGGTQSVRLTTSLFNIYR